jgi:hypothetical protein
MDRRDYQYDRPTDTDTESGERRTSGTMAANRMIVPLLLTGIIVMAIFLGFAYHNASEAEDGGGVYNTRVNSFCLPLNETALYQESGSRIDQLNISNAQIKFTGHAVEVSVNFFSPFVMDAPATDQDFRIYIDSRCLPPSHAFRPCTDPCPDAATSDDLLFNYSQTGYGGFIQGGVVSDYSLADDQDYSPDIFSERVIQGLVGEELFYGNKLILRIPAAATGDVVVSNMRMWLNYNMNTHLDWKIPAFCLDGPCLDADLSPDA